MPIHRYVYHVYVYDIIQLVHATTKAYYITKYFASEII